MTKKNLRSFELDLQVIQLSDESSAEFVEPAVEQVIEVLRVEGGELELEELRLRVDLSTGQLIRLVEALSPCRVLTKLVLTRLCSGVEGFVALAEFVKSGRAFLKYRRANF